MDSISTSRRERKKLRVDGQQLRAWRDSQKQKCTQEEAAEYLKISLSTYKKAENGDTPLFCGSVLIFQILPSSRLCAFA